MINKLVIIGESSGGVEALDYLIPKLRIGQNTILIISHLSNDYIYPNLCDYQISEEETEIEPGKKYHLFCYASDRNKEGMPYKHRFLLKNKTTGVYRDEITDYQINDAMKEVSNVYKNNCIGVILSGAGNDGSEGLKTIKNNGGIGLIQFENKKIKSEKYTGFKSYCNYMPQNALKKTKVDFTGPLVELVKVLNDYLMTPVNIT